MLESGGNKIMAETADIKEPAFVAGKKYPLIGVSVQTTNPWLRWGLPIATGLAVALVAWMLI
jgi:hypothetical protein